MVDLTLKQRTLDPSTIAFTAFEYDPAKVTFLNFGKEVGGTGNTSSAMSIVELLIFLGIHVHIVDLASTQLDLAIPYAAVAGVTVHQQDDGGSGEAAVLRAVTLAAPGQVVLVQYPASAIERIERVNIFLDHVLHATDAPVTAHNIWTMDSDRGSADTLSLMLDSRLPGSLSVNWPAWNGPPRIDDTVRRRVTATGGTVFAIPSLHRIYYDRFKRDRIAPATQHAQADAAARWEIDFWRHNVWQAVTSVS